MKSMQLILQHRQCLRYCIYRSISASASRRCQHEDDKPPDEVAKFTKEKTTLPATDLLRNAKQSKEQSRTVTQAKDEALQSLDTSVAFQEAIKDVANEYPDKEQTEEELLGQLNRHDEATAAAKSGQVDGISDILMGMKVQQTDESHKFEGMFGKFATYSQSPNKRQRHKQNDKEQMKDVLNEAPDVSIEAVSDDNSEQRIPQNEKDTGSQIPGRKIESDTPRRTKRISFGDGTPREPQDMSALLTGLKVTSEAGLRKSQTEGFQGVFRGPQVKTNFSQRLEVFQPSESPVVEEQPRAKSIWDIEQEKQLKDALYGDIHSGFQEMMKLTEEGKLWKYPIDNEQGMEEEQKVEFHEHIFLDHHLTEFPESKAIQNFMELVIIGLGKNPYLTVQQKIEHIDWFREYFRSKGDMVERFESAQ